MTAHTSTMQAIDIRRFAARLVEMRDSSLEAAGKTDYSYEEAGLRARASAFALSLDALFWMSGGMFGEDFAKQPDPYAELGSRTDQKDPRVRGQSGAEAGADLDRTALGSTGIETS
jgi:hypothetical protein